MASAVGLTEQQTCHHFGVEVYKLKMLKKMLKMKKSCSTQ